MSESVEERRRKEVINKILTFPANSYTRAFLDEPHPRTGKKYSNAELGVYLKELWDEAREKLDEDHAVRLGRIRAEQAAHEILYQLQRRKEMEPQIKAQLERDQETFNNAAKSLRSFGVNQANFSLTRQILGEGFSLSKIQQGLSSKALQLSPPTQQELDLWSAEDIEQHNQALLNADPDQLRARVRQEASDARDANRKLEMDRQLEVSRARDQAFNFPALPSEFTKEGLLQMVKNDTEKYRFLVKKFGNHNITARLQGRG